MLGLRIKLDRSLFLRLQYQFKLLLGAFDQLRHLGPPVICDLSFDDAGEGIHEVGGEDGNEKVEDGFEGSTQTSNVGEHVQESVVVDVVNTLSEFEVDV